MSTNKWKYLIRCYSWCSSFKWKRISCKKFI